MLMNFNEVLEFAHDLVAAPMPIRVGKLTGRAGSGDRQAFIRFVRALLKSRAIIIKDGKIEFSPEFLASIRARVDALARARAMEAVQQGSLADTNCVIGLSGSFMPVTGHELRCSSSSTPMPPQLGA